MNALLLTLRAATPDAGALPPQPVLPELRRLAAKLEPTLEFPWVKEWLRNIDQLKPVAPVTWYRTKDKQKCVPKDPKDPAYLARGR